MERIKFEITDWLFEFLLKLLFKFSNQYRLVKFNRTENKDLIDYELSIRTKRPVSKSLVDVEKNTSEYVKRIVSNNGN